MLCDLYEDHNSGREDYTHPSTVPWSKQGTHGCSLAEETHIGMGDVSSHLCNMLSWVCRNCVLNSCRYSFSPFTIPQPTPTNAKAETIIFLVPHCTTQRCAAYCHFPVYRSQLSQACFMWGVHSWISAHNKAAFGNFISGASMTPETCKHNDQKGSQELVLIEHEAFTMCAIFKINERTRYARCFRDLLSAERL